MGAKTPAQKAEEELAKQPMILIERITRREEWMARSLLHTGKVVLTGEYEGFEIDFGARPIRITTTLTRLGLAKQPILFQICENYVY